MMKGFRRMASVLVVVLLLTVGITPSYAYGPQGFLPNQIRHAYGVDKLPWDGSGQKIAIVGAFDYPNAAADLATFIQQFKLKQMNGLPGTPACTADAGPHPCFQTVQVESADQDAVLFWSQDTTWQMEMGSDVQWAHAIAPGADILLVAAKTNQKPDMMKAVDRAVELGASVISMSWGYNEESSDTDWNSHFSKPGVMFVAGSGDYNKLLFPATVPNVLAIGGTYIEMNADGTYQSESVYNNSVSGSVGGPSQYQQAPAYQQQLGLQQRTTPDVSWAAGFAGFATYVNGKWIDVTGTSLGTPQWAALVALVNQAGNTSFTDISKIYKAAATNYSHYFNDVTTGQGACNTSACAAKPGFDIATGLGTPKADALVYYLAGLPEPAPAPAPAPIPTVQAAPCSSRSCATLFTAAVQGTAGTGGIYQKAVLTANQRYTIEVQTSGAISFYMMNSSGRTLKGIGTLGASTFTYTYTPTSSGTYYFEVIAKSGTANYTITLQ